MAQTWVRINNTIDSPASFIDLQRLFLLLSKRRNIHHTRAPQPRPSSLVTRGSPHSTLVLTESRLTPVQRKLQATSSLAAPSRREFSDISPTRRDHASISFPSPANVVSHLESAAVLDSFIITQASDQLSTSPLLTRGPQCAAGSRLPTCSRRS